MLYRRSPKCSLPSIQLQARAGILLFALLVIPPAVAEQPAMRLRLKDSSFATGHVVPSERLNTVGWQADGFDSPFLFDARAVRSISALSNEEADSKLQGQFFELKDGSMISGKLLSIDEDWVTIGSDWLQEVKVTRDSVVSLVDAGYAGELIYSGPRDNNSWSTGAGAGTDPLWQFEAGALVAQKPGIAVVGNVDLPNRAQINVTLSWKGSPDFVFSFGTGPEIGSAAAEAVQAAARLEVWDKQLALLREVGDSADIELLAELSPASPRIELTVYLDQEAGTVIVCDAHGRPLDRMTLPAKDKTVRPAVRLVNHGPSLTLERFEVRAWDGVTTIGASGSGVVLGESNEIIEGKITGFDPANNELLLQMQDGQSRRIPLQQIRRGDFAAPESTGDDPAGGLPPAVEQPPQLGSKPPAEDSAEDALAVEDANQEPTGSPEAARDDLAQEAVSLFDSLAPPAVQPTQETNEPALIEVVWTDRTRLKGYWLPAEQGKLQFKANGLAEPFLFDAQLIRGIIGTEERFAVDQSSHKSGTIKIGDTQLAGYLQENTPPDSQSPLFWFPHGSRNSAAISQESEGAIIYRQPLPKVTTNNQTANRRQQDVIVAPMVQIFLGGNRPGNANANASPTNAVDSRANANDEREIVFRSGDAINGVIKSISENGVNFESSETQTTFAKHEQMQSVWLNRQRRELEVSPEKLERLMTVPRSMKKDPPTHLFISVLGDFLRGRLVSLDEENVSVEVRLEILNLPRDQVAQIIWLHDRDWSNDKNAKTDANPETDENPVDSVQAFRVHAIKATDRGLTFEPEIITEGVLRGTSDLLGECRVEIASLNQLLFGKNIAEQIREFNEDPWKLSLAQYPRVFLDSEEGGSSPGSGSPMVGELATDFGLKTLDGEIFRLSQSHDRVVVLDFWASWCGPCIQTMPLVEEVVEEIGVDKVHLVAVNIQETPARVQAAVDRLGLSATVLLDRDGEAAAAYAANAIPQTVIIDKEGKVTHVFVGGGSRFVEQFRQALQEVSK